jgi:hypothetical protein
MDEFEKILVLANEFEAEIVEEVLMDKQIPYGIVVREDSALAGITGLESGWGYLEAPPSFREQIMAIYEEIRNQDVIPGDEVSEGT